MRIISILSAGMLLLGMLLSGCRPTATQENASLEGTSTSTPPPSPTATYTSVPSSTPTDLPTATLTPTLAAGAIQVSAVDGMEMVYIPAGVFTMGSPAGTADEQPAHPVHLDAYWIDRTEVTNVMYSRCVEAGACLRPFYNNSNTHVLYYASPKFANYPVITLKWASAEKYCAWAGRRLPTEAEWEKAARGTDERAYPWGNANPDKTLLNFNDPVGDAVIVGSYLHGASPYGALDMAGNVSEWVADWYDARYYAISPESNPTGPADGQVKVLRGGSWHSGLYNVRSSDRFSLAPDSRDFIVGFRCAVSSP